MAKGKSKPQTGGSVSIQQKHLHSRISYLHQAATYLAHLRREHLEKHLKLSALAEDEHIPCQKGILSLYQQRQHQTISETSKDGKEDSEPGSSPVQQNTTVTDLPLAVKSKDIGISRRLLSHLRGVSLKGQIRLAPAMKHSICKGCDALLVTGSTSTSRVENKSRNGRKPWADVLVINCSACGTPKRYPLNTKRQSKKSDRTKSSAQTLQQMSKKETGGGDV